MTFRSSTELARTGGPEDRLLSWNRVRDLTGLSRSTVWRLQQAGEFPDPIRLSSNRVGWWESELTAWKAIQANRRLPQAKSLQRPARTRAGRDGAID